MKRITVHTEDINSYGFWVKSAGISLKRFKRNPVMLYNHARSSSYNPTAIMPLGRWEDLKIDANGNMTATPVFDLNDEMGAKLADKYENGFVNTASIGISILARSEEKKHLKQGQRRSTVMKAELREISFCDIPSNANAVRLYLDDVNGDELCLSLNASNADTFLNDILPNINSEQEMKNVIALMCATFALGETATDEQLTAALQSFIDDNESLSKQVLSLVEDAGKSELAGQLHDQVQALTTEMEGMKTERAKERAESLVNLAVSQGKLTKAESAEFVDLALTDAGFNSVKKIIATRKSVKLTITGAIEQAQGGAGSADLSDAELYDDMAKKGTLAKLKAADPDTFDRLQTAKIESTRA